MNLIKLSFKMSFTLFSTQREKSTFLFNVLKNLFGKNRIIQM